MSELLEKLEKAKEAAESVNEALESLGAAFDDINEEMCSTEMDYHIRESIVKMLTENDPVLEQGTSTIDTIDFVIESLPEQTEDEIADDFNDY